LGELTICYLLKLGQLSTFRNMSKTRFLYTQLNVRVRERARRRALFDISLKEISNYYYDSLNYISGNLVDAF